MCETLQLYGAVFCQLTLQPHWPRTHKNAGPLWLGFSNISLNIWTGSQTQRRNIHGKTRDTVRRRSEENAGRGGKNISFVLFRGPGLFITSIKQTCLWKNPTTPTSICLLRLRIVWQVFSWGWSDVYKFAMVHITTCESWYTVMLPMNRTV